MIGALSTDPYEALFVRKDGSLFPVEISGKNINENVRLGVIRDITSRRCQQAVSRVQQAGLEADRIDHMAKVVRIMCDELEDMGLPFEAVGVNIIDEENDQFISYAAYPESKGYRSFQDARSLQQFMQSHAPIRGLVSHWRRNKVWEREADEEFAQMVRESSMGSSYSPALMVDVPFPQGTLVMGLSSTRTVRVEDVATLLQALSQPLSCILKRLQEIESLTVQLRQARGEDIAAT